jgi:STE24 endopeptidase
MNAFTLVFAAALLLSLGTRLWLAARHIRHVQAHRERVPEAFAGAISAESHR